MLKFIVVIVIAITIESFSWFAFEVGTSVIEVAVLVDFNCSPFLLLQSAIQNWVSVVLLLPSSQGSIALQWKLQLGPEQIHLMDCHWSNVLLPTLKQPVFVSGFDEPKSSNSSTVSLVPHPRVIIPFSTLLKHRNGSEQSTVLCESLLFCLSHTIEAPRIR